MKLLVFCIVSAALGFAGGATVRFSERWQNGFQEGYRIAIEQSHREAVREGHGHWEQFADSVRFRWNEFRRGYAPDTMISIPGLE